MGALAEEPEHRPSITKVWAKNFRSIQFAELELDPLTVLVGPNASGKSNLMDILGSSAMWLALASKRPQPGVAESTRLGRKTPKGRVLGPEIGVQYRIKNGTLEYAVALDEEGRGRVSNQARVRQV